MRKTITALCIIHYILYIVCSTFSFCQDRWTTNPFEHKVFIANKGQFNGKNNLNNSNIQYAVTHQEVNIYFTNRGLTYLHDEVQQLSDAEGESEEEQKQQTCKQNDKGEKQRVKTIPYYVHMEWIGANPDAKIIGEDTVSYYFTYGGPKDSSGKSGIKAPAYKKIIYKNIYPNIDVEYTFPDNKRGIKYALVLYPGADVSSIKMKYFRTDKIVLDKQGNIQIHTSFGNIVDHTPETFYKRSNLPIASSFNINNNMVTFQLADFDHSQTIIIDPWTANPNFPVFNSAYDVEYDLQGNVYVYGGRGGSGNPWREIKLNNTGAIQWVYTTTPFTIGNGWPQNYGDFAVDGKSGSSYIVEGMCSLGARVIKLNASGMQIGVFPGTGNPGLIEMWRIVYNNCTQKAIIGGAGTGSPYQACILDTNGSSMTPVNVLSATEGFHDICLLALDNSNNCYMATAKSINANPLLFDNVLLKCPANTLLPVTYMVPDNHAFREVLSVNYVNSAAYANGFNGMAVSNNYLYTYDGSLIQRWNKNTGVLINSATISPTPFSWGGIAVDDCDNIFVGKQSSVIQYDTNFTVISTIPMASAANTVYDVKVAPGNLLYVCGKGFVSSFIVSGTSVTCNNCTQSSALTVNVTFTNILCNGFCNGTATATPDNGTSPYTYSWNITPVQTTATATGLCAGAYTVTVTDAAGNTAIATGAVTQPSVLTATISPAPAACGNNGSATVNAGGGTPGYIYNWSNGQTTSIATGLAAGNYTATITDTNGCTQTQTITVTSTNVLSVNVSSTQTGCAVNNGTATAIPLSGTAPYTYSWSNGQTSPIATGLGAGTYTLTITDASGCTQTQTISITQTPGPTVVASASPNTIIIGASTTLTASGGGTYSWSPLAGLSCITCLNPTAFPSITTLYCVTLTDTTTGCSDSACVTVLVELDCSNLDELYLPNAFSPNNDGENDKLRIYYGNLKCINIFKLVIYNRWGEKVFETNDPSAGWDGSFRGKIEGTVVFVYYLKATLISGEEIMRKGNISLIR